MNLQVYSDVAAVETAAAARIAELVTAKPNAVLGLATGATMTGVYARLAEHCRRGVSFRHVRSFNLDEYVGLEPAALGSYEHYMADHFVSRTDINPANVHLPSGTGTPEETAERYDAMLATYGSVDLQLLGIGLNGHIGFNEPGSSFSSRTRLVALTECTLEANRRHFPKGVNQPTQAITMGIGTILSARSILMLATGARKRSVLGRLISGERDLDFPASALHIHDDLLVIADQAAAPGKR